MASKQRFAEEERSTERRMDGDEQPIGPAGIASVASVGLALYYYFLKGDRQRGLFVGLWAPTILSFASYLDGRKIRQQLDTLTRPASTIKDTIESMVR